MTRRMLPIGMQSFRDLRERGCAYVDKTGHLRQMAERGKHYFLSRPRRFGKSLLLDTAKELFEGHETLFRGLAVHGNWDWSRRHPVVRVDFVTGTFSNPGELELNIRWQLTRAERRAGLHQSDDVGGAAPADQRLANLIETLHARTGKRVVLLVDEYDKPIVDLLDQPDQARANREILGSLYSVIKACDASIEFSLLTGVSRFSKVNLFSGLNNLRDITLEPGFASICGISEQELETEFAAELVGLDRQRIRHWYNGYNWRGPDRLYNPFGLLLFLETREFRPYWFESGTPTFLIDMLLDRGISPAELEGLSGSDELLSAFDVDGIATQALLFQTGYLTIKEEVPTDEGSSFRLGYPNHEVQQSLNRSLLQHVCRPGGPPWSVEATRVRRCLAQNDMDALRDCLHGFFAGIPNQWFSNRKLERYEGFYAAVFYAYFASAGLDIAVEESTNLGRIDMVVTQGRNVFLLEFKVIENEGEGTAMTQLRNRSYADKYRGQEFAVHLVAVEFSSAARNIVSLEAAAA